MFLIQYNMPMNANIDTLFLIRNMYYIFKLIFAVALTTPYDTDRAFNVVSVPISINVRTLTVMYFIQFKGINQRLGALQRFDS